MSTKGSETKEKVLVVPRRLLISAGYIQGFSVNIEKYLAIINDKHLAEFINRDIAEHDPEYKQIIPYVLLEHNGKLFSYRRGLLLKERRLLGRYSIGLGGHIGLQDQDLFSEEYEQAMLREISEEVSVYGDYAVSIKGIINDDSNEVGSVHLGLVHLFRLESDQVEPKEKSINECKFLSIRELRDRYKNYETWSQICIDNISEILGDTMASPEKRSNRS